MLGVLALAAGLVGAALVAAAVPSSVVGLILAAAVGGAGVGVGALGFQTAARRQRDAERQARRDRELAILQLAEERGGALTATEVARELHIAPDEAEDALTAMVGDGTRVGVEVDREGVLRYAFRELMPPPELRVRVEPEPETEPSEVSAEGQRAAEGRAPEG
ncbi:MAG: hypothetical protein ACFCGT_24865 [Sandaracinaceae bacterium]